MSLSLSTFKPAEEIIHGVLVRDPYRWLEERNLPETEQWIRNQQERFEDYFDGCPDLDVIRSRVREYLDVEIVDQVTKIAERYYYRRRSRGEEQASIFSFDPQMAIERRLVDPLRYGPFYSVSIHQISKDGRFLAFELRHGGEDARSIHFIDVDRSLILPDKIEAGYPRGLAFTPDGKGFFYCHELLADTQEHTVNLHLFNESVADLTVFRLARTRGDRLVLTADFKHLGVVVSRQVVGEYVIDFWIADLHQPDHWELVFAKKKAPFYPFLAYGRLFAISFECCPNGRLIEFDKNGRELRVIIPEQPSPIRQLVISGDRFFASYIEKLTPRISSWAISGEPLGHIDLPAGGSVRLLSNFNEEGAVFYSYESFSQPLIIFEYLPGSSRSEIWHMRQTPGTQASYKVKETQYPSKDGTRIPITLVQSKPEADYPAPAIVTSYGGFGVSASPQFSALAAIMMELGAIFVLPHIRGGGEMGIAWHHAARGRERQVAFDDFIAAQEWLLKEGVTTVDKLAIVGGSNSGLLVAAAMTQRPDLFRAVLCVAPLLDMVRYERFDRAIHWREEYGTAEDKGDFNALYAYSPYHHIQEEENYPSVLFVTGDKDDRCNPAHVRKMAARLKERSAQANPVLVDYSEQRGHSPALPLSVRIEALARRISFLCRELGIPRPQAEAQ